MASRLRYENRETLKQERPATRKREIAKATKTQFEFEDGGLSASERCEGKADFDGSEDLVIVRTLDAGPKEVDLTDGSDCRRKCSGLDCGIDGQSSIGATSCDSQHITSNITTTEVSSDTPIAKRVKRHPRSKRVNYAENGSVREAKMNKRRAAKEVVVLDSDEDGEHHSSNHCDDDEPIDRNNSIIILDLTIDGQCEEVLIDLTNSDKDNAPEENNGASHPTSPHLHSPLNSLQTPSKSLDPPPITQRIIKVVTKSEVLSPPILTPNLRSVTTQSCTQLITENVTKPKPLLSPGLMSSLRSVNTQSCPTIQPTDVHGGSCLYGTYCGQYIRPRGFLRGQPYHRAPRGSQAVHRSRASQPRRYGASSRIPRVPGHHNLDGRDDYVGRVYREIMKKPSVADLMLRKLIIFVDLDNWSAVFKHLPRPLPKGVFVWGFFGGHTNWRIPMQSASFNSLVVDKGFYLHPRCGARKDAADFALCMQAGVMHAGLPTSIPFVILSGDKGFEELRQQLRQEERPRQAYFINPHTRSPETLYSMLCCLVEQKRW